MSTLRISAPLDKAIDIGAIVAKVQLDRIRNLVDQGVADGATCWQPQVTLPARGFYYPPTLLSNVHPTSIVAQQEIFGPVLAAMTFRTLAEAVELANNTVYGLAACVWSESINVALHVAAQLKAGVVWVNCTNLFDASLLFLHSKYAVPACCNASFTNIPPLDTAFDQWQHAANSSGSEHRFQGSARSHRRALYA